MNEEIKEMPLDERIEKLFESGWVNEFNYLENQLQEARCLVSILQKENKKLKDELKYTIPQAEHNQIVSKLCREKQDYKTRNEKAIENAKEKIKRYEGYIHELKNGNYPSPTIRQERQELIFRIIEQEDLINALQGGDE